MGWFGTWFEVWLGVWFGVGVAEMPGWFGVLGLALVVPGLLLVGVLGRGVEGVVGSERRAGMGVVRWGASVRGVSVRGFVVGLGWRDGP
ncbi:hypothetical protein [Streptomyces sp. NPDC102360]|uniref:hypothetical protein n=1 Tax=Streptomyces sp. NPDC102360 TaxID=3366160 RepID=UPI00380D7A72